ncbi:MAG: ribonuclease HII [Bdellovibrionaceae bacterium]|jgi:ribonuclease HII|nr:ribonuclease HII [Pseudobdellovibrionaceae bacterium]
MSSELPAFDWRSYSPRPYIGVDEVGRGCLAGSVYACAVILNEDNSFTQYTDSKKLSAKKRDLFYDHITNSHNYGIGFATIEEITQLNILHASLLAMKRAVEKLGVKSGHIFVDGNQKIPGLKSFEQTTVVKGDLRVPCIAAASIVAKVTRDRELEVLARQYPQYGLEKHKGYGTKTHKEALKKWGPCPIHRPTFAGVKELL